jgi:signal transduction histidine kinase
MYFAIIRLFLKVKYGSVSLADVYDIFSALPFMWLLAVAMVKIIDTRTRLHETQTENFHNQEQLRLKEIQLNTMKEVVRGLQHHVNNPLAIISLCLSRVRRRFSKNAEGLDDVEQIQLASKRISEALSAFSNAQKYESEQSTSIVGTIAIPPKQ